MAEQEQVVVRERRPLPSVSLGGLIKLLGVLLLALALIFAFGWLTKGTWQEWVTAGLLAWIVSEVV
jgi:flagellar biogenesis protein FliO